MGSAVPYTFDHPETAFQNPLYKGGRDTIFITEDPVGFGGGDINLYAYVGGNPIRFIDPWGLSIGDSSGWGVSVGGTLMGADLSTTIYNSNLGWFPSTETNISVSTTLVGGGIQINTNIRYDNSSPNEDLNVSVGLSKYLGVSYNTQLSRGSINIGLGLGLPVSFGTPVQNFSQGLSDLAN